MTKLKLELTPTEVIALLESIDTLESMMMEDMDTLKDIKCLDKMLKKHGIDRKKFDNYSAKDIRIEDM